MTVFEVVIIAGKVGFPRGVWMRVLYQAQANEIVTRLADEGVTAEVRKVEE